MSEQFLVTDLMDRAADGVVVNDTDLERLALVHTALAKLLTNLGLTVTTASASHVSWNRSEDGAEVTLVPIFVRQRDEEGPLLSRPQAAPAVRPPDVVLTRGPAVPKPSRRRWSWVPEEAQEEDAYYEEVRRSVDPRWEVLQDLYPRTRKNPQVTPGLYLFADLWQVTAPGAVAGRKAEVKICGSIGSGPKNVASNIIMQLATATHASTPLKYRNNR